MTLHMDYCNLVIHGVVFLLFYVVVCQNVKHHVGIITTICIKKLNVMLLHGIFIIVTL